ncbi:MAG TPA: hypothetical protein VEV81_05185 [Pyrinomonadaceae bacterium]|nr:hypothetical protein [Pyrinomonadaceae bacterium]
MRFTRTAFITALALLLLTTLMAQAQTPDPKAQHFNKDGLVFDYPNGWTVSDESTKDAQQLTLGRSDSEAQIRLFVHRGKVDTPEKMAQAKKAFIDPYVASVNNIFVQMGAKPEQTTASTQVGTAAAEGVRVRASLSGEPGEATICWLTVGNRVVVLTFFGPDKALKKAAPAWDTLRNSLHVEEAKPPQKTAPK